MTSPSAQQDTTPVARWLRYTSIREIEAANTAAGYHFFEPATLRFFRSKVYPEVYGQRGTYFVTSEQFDARSPRLYTIRTIDWECRISTVGEFQQYPTLRAARKAAAEVAAFAGNVLP